MSTRTSSRQAAQKAKEAISDPNGKASTGTKRKGPAEKGPPGKRGKQADEKPEVKKEQKPDLTRAEPEPVQAEPKREELTPSVAEGIILSARKSIRTQV